MLERIVAAIALALFSWLERRAERGSVAVDSEHDRARLARGGARIREWLQQDSARQQRQSGADRTSSTGTGVHASAGRMDTQSEQR